MSEYKYQIQIGEVIDLSGVEPKRVPKTIFHINREQVDIIESLANVEYSDDAEKFYVINKLRFKIATVIPARDIAEYPAKEKFPPKP